MTRQEANLEILENLIIIAKHHSQLRFHQLLWNMGMENCDDRFHEESVTTLKRLEGNRQYCLTLEELLK